MLTVLDTAGFSDESLLLAYQAYMRYVVGGSVVEAMPRPTEQEPAAPDDLDTAQRRDNPRVAALRELLRASTEQGHQHELAEHLFSEGLRLLLGGLANRAKAPAGR